MPLIKSLIIHETNISILENIKGIVRIEVIGRSFRAPYDYLKSCLGAPLEGLDGDTFEIAPGVFWGFCVL